MFKNANRKCLAQSTRCAYGASFFRFAYALLCKAQVHPCTWLSRSLAWMLVAREGALVGFDIRRN